MGYAIVEAYQQYLRRIDYEAEVEAVAVEWWAGGSVGAVDEASGAVTNQPAGSESATWRWARGSWCVDAGISRPLVFLPSPDTAYRAGLHGARALVGE